MIPGQAEEYLIGKTISKINHYSYGDDWGGWAMCIESIEFTDGSIIEMGGNADEARIDTVIFPDGSSQNITFKE